MTPERALEINRTLNALEILADTIDPSANVKLKCIEMGGDELVLATIRNGKYTVNITADSPAAIVKDVVDSLFYKI